MDNRYFSGSVCRMTLHTWPEQTSFKMPAWPDLTIRQPDYYGSFENKTSPFVDPSAYLSPSILKASFWGLFKTNFYGYFRKLFLFTKYI